MTSKHDNGRVAADLAGRFWARVDQGNECWEWTGCRDKRHGYGMLMLGSRRDDSRRPERASRVAWTLTYGPIPDGLFVCHRCDNPPCVRPDHLFLGTCADNVHDMMAKGRANNPIRRGESCGHAKLTKSQVHAIRRRVADGEKQSRLASEYGVSRATVCCIIQGTRWEGE